MASIASRVVVPFAVLALGIVAWVGASSGADTGNTFFHGKTHEVLAGTYYCRGNTYVGEQEPWLYAFSGLRATSGITEDFYSPDGGTNYDVPDDIDAIEGICESHISELVSEAPSICVFGQIVRRRSDYESQSEIDLRIDFVCQGKRGAVIGAIGGFATAPLRL